MSGSKPTIADLQQQLKSIQAEIESRRLSAKSEVRADIEQMLKDADLALSDVFPELTKLAKTTVGKTRGRAEVAARYKDPASGSLWSGRGRSPKWVEAVLQARGITIKEFKQQGDFAV
jgi:DNA-binding protein H-NS